MKLFSKVLSILALSAIFFSCSDDDDNNSDRLVPISLSSRVTFEQRALQDFQIVEGQSLSFFVDVVGSTGDPLYNNVEITADGNGGFDYDSPMYYPSTNDNVNFYAIHPYSTTASLNQSLSFSVAANQSTNNGYLSSDLLYATRADVSRTASSVAMVFSHMLSKFDITIVQGDGINLEGFENIQILNLLPTTSITPAIGTLSTATGTGTTITPYGIPDNVSGTGIDNITAIVVPQNIPAGQTLLSITIDGANYTYEPRTALTFESGTRYGFIITVNQTGIEVTSTITPWEDGGSIEGDGSLD